MFRNLSWLASLAVLATPSFAKAAEYNIPRVVELLQAGNPVGIPDGQFGRAYIAGFALKLNSIATEKGCRTAEISALMLPTMFHTYSYLTVGKQYTLNFDIPATASDLLKAAGGAVELGYFLTAGLNDAKAFAASVPCEGNIFQTLYRNIFMLMPARGLKPTESPDLYRLTAYASPQFKAALDAAGIFTRYEWGGEFMQIDGIDVIASLNDTRYNFVDFINPAEDYIPDLVDGNARGIMTYRIARQYVGSLIQVKYGHFHQSGITHYHLSGDQWPIVEEDIQAARVEVGESGAKFSVITCWYQYDLAMKGGATRTFWYPKTPTTMEPDRLKERIPDHPYLKIGKGREKCPATADAAKAAF